MCGIAGFFETHSRSHDARSIIARMTRRLEHRGPDDEGLWLDAGAGIALGQRRLSILDLSPLGHQPMFSASGRFAIVFNGEIYNFPELRGQLEYQYPFRGGSDTEVMLAAFEQWGIEPALRRFNGMFAFALWDRRERTLTLARDRFGEKPLYYGRAGSSLLFASELKALRAHPEFEAEIDRDVLALYFRYNYIPGPHSIYRGIHKLPPGTFVQVTAGNALATPAPRTYWSAAEVIERGADGFLATEEDTVDALEHRLASTVRSRMVSDVPLGAFLSGGVDSSLIVALMQRASSQPVRTFTIAFEDPGYNEANHALAVARHLGTDHTELPVTPTEALGVIPGLASIYDEPFADASQIPTLLIASLARRHVTVALSGDGGDELFGGYTRYSWHDHLWRALIRIPKPARQAVSGVLAAIPRPAWDAAWRAVHPVTPRAFRQRNPVESLEKLRAIFRAGDPNLIYRALVSIWPDPALVVPGTHDIGSVITAATGSALTDPTTRLMLLDTVSYLPDDILVKVDRASMSVALETRAPFLDHEVFEFAARLPMEMKVRAGRGKWILRRLLDRFVPREMIDRPKAGFAVPLDDWLRGRLRPWAEELLSARNLEAAGLNAPAIRRKWAEHVSRKQSWMYPLWGVLMFQAWRQSHQAPVDEADAFKVAGQW